jgi:branched-chain amino acid transport system substrate-binding protein
MNPLFRVVASALVVLGVAAGAQAQEGGKRILIGQSIVHSGPGSTIAQQYHAGAKLMFDRLNARGGVNGRRIELVSIDDHGQPASTAANTRTLLDQGVLCLFGYYGSPQVAAAYPMIKDAGVLMFAPMAAGDDIRSAQHGNIYMLRPGYADEALAITKHAETVGARKFAIIHRADGESMAALESAERSLTRAGARVVAKAPVGSGSVANGVDSALAASPESVLVIADANGAAGVVRDLRAKNFKGQIYGFSSTGESLLAEELGRDGAGVVVVRVVPKSENPKATIARDLNADALAANIGKPNVYMMEGYIAAKVMAEAFARIDGEPTRAKLRNAIEGLQDLNVGGFRVHYGKERVGSKLVELALIDSQGKVRE